jgi:hypothetical protein
LAALAKRSAKADFIARLLVGVHGQPEIGLHNPLTHADIRGFARWLLPVQSER